MDTPLLTPRPVPSVQAMKTACSSCNLRELCLPVALQDNELERLDSLVAQRLAVPRGETLYRARDPFRSLYAVRSGFFKTLVTTADGREQVTGFLMAGELLGFDGIGTDRYSCDTVALEDSQVCVIPFEQLEALSRDFLPLQRQFHRIMSREIVRDHGLILLLGSMRAEERLAAFLLNLTQRLASRVMRSTSSVEEIGSYLGLKLETVSRAFSKLQDQGLLAVRHRQVRVVDPAGLRRLVDTLC
jgi:CRP/FNR family transcriptional regulator